MKQYSIWTRFEVSQTSLEEAFKELEKHLDLVCGYNPKILKEFTRDFYPIVDKFEKDKIKTRK